MIHADFDGITANVRATAHGTDPGKVVLAIGGPLGGSIVIDANDAPTLQREIGSAHVKALALRAEHGQATALYAHA
jgi:hypothetical protein